MSESLLHTEFCNPRGNCKTLWALVVSWFSHINFWYFENYNYCTYYKLFLSDTWKLHLYVTLAQWVAKAWTENCSLRKPLSVLAQADGQWTDGRKTKICLATRQESLRHEWHEGHSSCGSRLNHFHFHLKWCSTTQPGFYVSNGLKLAMQMSRGHFLDVLTWLAKE